MFYKLLTRLRRRSEVIFGIAAKMLVQFCLGAFIVLPAFYFADRATAQLHVGGGVVTGIYASTALSRGAICVQVDDEESCIKVNDETLAIFKIDQLVRVVYRVGRITGIFEVQEIQRYGPSSISRTVISFAIY
ncbi:MAG TPA: hypothetical protein VD928_02020 [Candidatus Paceibacterota bacterium]|nr:hypothetical protein [Candidatus Paceibacterota bacterium]